MLRFSKAKAPWVGLVSPGGSAPSFDPADAGKVVYISALGSLAVDAGLTYNDATNTLTAQGDLEAVGQARGASLLASGLASGKMVYTSTGGLLAVDSALSYDSGTKALSITGGSIAVNGATLASMTPGSVLYAGAGGLVSQNNSHFVWDNSARTLKVETITLQATTATGGYDRFMSSATNGAIVQGAAILFNPGGASRVRMVNGYGTVFATNVGVQSAFSSASLDSAQSFATGIVRVTSGLTLSYNETTVLVDATSAPVTITLPLSSTATRRIYNIKKIDSSVHAVTIARTGSDLIDGAASQVMTVQYQSLTVQAEGGSSNAWWLI